MFDAKALYEPILPYTYFPLHSQELISIKFQPKLIHVYACQNIVYMVVAILSRSQCATKCFNVCYHSHSPSCLLSPIRYVRASTVCSSACVIAWDSPYCFTATCVERIRSAAGSFLNTGQLSRRITFRTARWNEINFQNSVITFLYRFVVKIRGSLAFLTSYYLFFTFTNVFACNICNIIQSCIGSLCMYSRIWTFYGFQGPLC